MSEVIHEAIFLLTRRRGEIEAQVRDLLIEQGGIDTALSHLRGETPNEVVAGQKMRSVRQLSLDLINRAPVAYSHKEITEHVQKYRTDRSYKELAAAVRTAMWNLRTSGEAVQIEKGVHIGSKWTGLS